MKNFFHGLLVFIVCSGFVVFIVGRQLGYSFSKPQFIEVIKEVRSGSEFGLSKSRVIGAMIRVESSSDPFAVSQVGAIGLMQLMPETAKELDVDPFDPEENIRGGRIYLEKMLERFGELRLALAAYNWGPSNVARVTKDSRRGTYEEVVDDLPIETRDYVRKVLTIAAGVG